MNIHFIFYFTFFLFLSCTNSAQEKLQFVNEITTPDGFERVSVKENSFGEYLRNLPLKIENNIVYLHNGKEKYNQDAQFAIIKIDVGKRDLQQCADAVMRLRGEYLYKQKKYKDIHFNFTNGQECNFLKYASGFRAVLKGNKIIWVKKAKPNSSYPIFRKYMDLVFAYAGTWSLNKELKSVKNISEIKIGDVFIQTGRPYGHAVIVLDVAENSITGQKTFMLAQSYMPAQEIHILKNPSNKNLSPWYSENFAKELVTPEWTFYKNNLKRFPKIKH